MDIASFQAISGADEATAKRYLGAAQGNLEAALSNFFDAGELPQEDFVPPVIEPPPPVVEEPEPLPESRVKSVLRAAAGDLELPLQGISVSCSVKDMVAEVEASMVYCNSSPQAIEATYEYEQAGATVWGFTVRVGDKTTHGVCQPKEEALDTYEDAISAGDQGFLLERAANKDLFTLSVGNLQPGQDALITLKYAVELGQQGSAARLELPLASQVPPSVDPDPSNPLHELVPPGMQFTASFAMSSPIRDVTCESGHAVNVEVNGAEATISFRSSLEDKDARGAVILVDTEAGSSGNPSLAVEVDEGAGDAGYGHALMASFHPHLEAGEDEDVLCEMIFIVDRSGSMAGSRMKQTKNALQLFLRSLPIGTLFNVVGFGDSYQSLFPQATAYSQASFARAVSYVNGMDASLGGTNILDPLRFVLSQPPRPGFPRQVFLLTDGEVDNTDAILDLVRGETSTRKVRLFTLGVGMDASRALVRGIAREGGGQSEFVASGTRIETKVIRQLQRALQPIIKDVSVDWGELPVVQAPRRIPSLFSGEPLLVYGLLSNAEVWDPAKEYKIALKARTDERDFSFDLTVKLSEAKQGQLIHRLATKAALKDHGDGAEGALGEAALTGLAVRYGLPSAFTSLVASVEGDAAAEGQLKRVDVGKALEGTRSGAALGVQDAQQQKQFRAEEAEPEQAAMMEDMLRRVEMEEERLVKEEAPRQRAAPAAKAAPVLDNLLADLGQPLSSSSSSSSSRARRSKNSASAGFLKKKKKQTAFRRESRDRAAPRGAAAAAPRAPAPRRGMLAGPGGAPPAPRGYAFGGSAAPPPPAPAGSMGGGGGGGGGGGWGAPPPPPQASMSRAQAQQQPIGLSADLDLALAPASHEHHAFYAAAAADSSEDEAHSLCDDDEGAGEAPEIQESSATRPIDRVVQRQQFAGNWSLDSLADLLPAGMTPATALQALPAPLSGLASKEALWATALALAILARDHAGAAAEWELTARKAKKYLRKGLSGCELGVDELVELATALLSA